MFMKLTVIYLNLRFIAMRRSLFLQALIVFVITFLVYLSNVYIDYKKDFDKTDFRRVMTSSDQTSNTFLPWLILEKHTILFDDIDQYLTRFDGFKKNPYFLYKRDGHTYSSYPILTGIAAVPIYAIPVLLNKIPDLKYYDNLLKTLLLGRITASFYTALTVAIVFLTLSKISKDKFLIYLFTVFFAFGTTAWSISSRGMWQHTVSGFFIALLVYLFINIKPKYIPLAGIILGLAVLTRSTNVIVAAVMTVYVFFNYRKQFPAFILAALPAAGFMLIYNNFVFGSPFSEGYGTRNDLQWNTPLLVGLSGFLLSPARSFIFISSPLILSFFTMFKVFKDKIFGAQNNTSYRYLSVTFLISLIFFAKWKGWSGANGFGYRNLTDYLPILIPLAFETASETLKAPNVKIKLNKAFLIALVTLSIAVNANAVFNRKSRCDSSADWKFVCLYLPSGPGQ